MKRVIFAIGIIACLAGNAFGLEKTPTREKLDTMAKQVIVTDMDIVNMLQSKEMLIENFDKEGLAEVLMQMKELLKINAEMIDRIRRVM